MKARHAPKIRCARCDARLADPSKRIYSSWTKNHFCSDIDACGARVARRNKRTKRPQTDAQFRALTQVDESGCWIWQGRITTLGYGGLGRFEYAHRVSYEMFVGAIPPGLVIDHVCENRACVNPDHLRPLTINENARRSSNHPANRTHCPQGHEYTPDNTRRNARGRLCRTCNREKCAARKKKLRVAM